MSDDLKGVLVGESWKPLPYSYSHKVHGPGEAHFFVGGEPKPKYPGLWPREMPNPQASSNSSLC